MGCETAFLDLRRLSDWFAALSATARASIHVERIVERLGARCIPLLGRELVSRDVCRRDAARAALAHVAARGARGRVIAELKRIAASDASDDGKVTALGLLAELGERGAARLSDPRAIQRRSAIALAAELDTAADVAAAADLMVSGLDDDDMVQLLEVLAEVAPGAAHRVGGELCVRLDVAIELRDRVADVVIACEPPPCPPRRARPTHVAVLVDATGRTVVLAARKISGERRWRRWAVLIDAPGRITDCVQDDHAGTDPGHTPLVASLMDDGYRITSVDGEHARAIVARAARLSADALPASYYLGRDLLDLGDAHLPRPHASGSPLGHAIELIAAGEHAHAQAVLARCDGRGPDVAAAIAACLLVQRRPADAIPHLVDAIDAEPEWPLHHWNLATACHQLGDASGCYHALRRFVATSAEPSGLRGDPEQPDRIALAQRWIGELERTSRLTGTSLRRKRKARS